VGSVQSAIPLAPQSGTLLDLKTRPYQRLSEVSFFPSSFSLLLRKWSPIDLDSRLVVTCEPTTRWSMTWRGHLLSIVGERRDTETAPNRTIDKRVVHRQVSTSADRSLTDLVGVVGHLLQDRAASLMKQRQPDGTKPKRPQTLYHSGWRRCRWPDVARQSISC
jgi:hypothetical protein